jgi:oxygen-independent coproporphyrinogen-3 oxidase
MNIYVHVPFCRSKCAYCGFLSHRDIGLQDKYTDKLCEEIEARLGGQRATLTTIYFGGGTPSLMNPMNLSKILEALKKTSSFSKKIEITLEVNPEDISNKNLESWKNIGISRISIGVQSLNDDVRNVIHRSLSGAQVLERIIRAQKYFSNLGVDLISALPGEDLANFRTNLLKIIDLGVGHISIYDLEISKGSQFYNNPAKYIFPSEDKQLKLLTTAWRVLEDSGYDQYEISNFAKDKNYCRHNLDFWLGEDYLGFGLGSASKIGNIILENQSDLGKYFKDPIKSQKKTLLDNKSEKLLNISSITRLGRPLPPSLIDDFSDITNELVADGFLDRNFVITQKGRLFNNYILDRFARELLT